MPAAQFVQALLDAGFAGWKQRDIAKRLGTSQTRITRWKQQGIGLRSKTSADDLMAILRKHGPAYQDQEPHPNVLHHTNFTCWRTMGSLAHSPCIGPTCAAWTETDRPEPKGFCAALAALHREPDADPDYALFPVMERDPYPSSRRAKVKS